MTFYPPHGDFMVPKTGYNLTPYRTGCLLSTGREVRRWFRIVMQTSEEN